MIEKRGSLRVGSQVLVFGNLFIFLAFYVLKCLSLMSQSNSLFFNLVSHSAIKNRQTRSFLTAIALLGLLSCDLHWQHPPYLLLWKGQSDGRRHARKNLDPLPRRLADARWGPHQTVHTRGHAQLFSRLSQPTRIQEQGLPFPHARASLIRPKTLKCLWELNGWGFACDHGRPAVLHRMRS